MVHKIKTWIVVADAAHARVFEQIGAGPIQALPDLVFARKVPTDRELFSDRPARAVDRVGGGRHAVERHDRDQEHRAAFVRAFAEPIERGAIAGAFDRLVLVCAPHTLGEVRAALGPHATQRVVKEIAKDFAKVPDADLVGRLANALTT